MGDQYRQPSGGLITPSKGAVNPAPDTPRMELQYAENATGVATGPVASAGTAFAANPVAIPLTDIIVPVCSLPVYLDAFALGQQTTAGAGLAFLEIWETTSGVPVVLCRNNGKALPNLINADARRNFDVRIEPVRLGPVASVRTFQLRLNTFGNGASPAWQVANFNAIGLKTYLRAVAW